MSYVSRINRNNILGFPTWSRWVLWYLLFVASALIALGVNPMRQQTLTPLDLLASQPAWSWANPDLKPRHAQRSDILNALLPAWMEARKQIRAGHWPSWNPTSAGGTPLTTPNVSTYTPGFLAFALADDPAQGFLFSTVLNLSIAGLGMFLLLRRDHGTAPALFAALSLQLCGFHAAWLYWPHMFTAIWIPWCFWGVCRNARQPGPVNTLLLAILFALCLLGGFPFLALLMLLSCALLTLFWLFQCNDWNTRFSISAWMLAAVGISFLLAALPLVELFHWLGNFDLGYREGRGSYLNLGHAKQLLPWEAKSNLKVEESMYVGTLGLALAAAGLVHVLLCWRKAPLISRFFTVLTIIAGALVFGIIPLWMVGWVPGMSYNSWSRAIILLDIALLASSAYSLSCIALSISKQWMWHWLFLLACLAQLTDMHGYFRRYNAAVDARLFYPDTPITRYLSTHAGPFDHVLADNGFLFSGTLGAYGLNEWHAHQFHSPAARKLLESMVEDPFVSATASKFPARAIRWNSPFLDTLNVRYIAVRDPGKAKLIPIQHPSTPLEPMPNLPSHSWRQQFQTRDAAILQWIGIRMATYHQSNLPGMVQVCLDTSTKEICTRLPAAAIRDNQVQRFYFPFPVTLQRGNHSFTVRYYDGPTGTPLTAWAHTDSIEGQSLTIDDAPHEGSLSFELGKPPREHAGFKHLMSWQGISLYENIQSPRGPYLLATLSAPVTTASSQGISVRDYQAERFDIEVAAGATGCVVVPMRHMEGWTAHVNGQPAKIRLKDGVMPAVDISGPATIHFQYASYSSRYFVEWLASLLAVLVLLSASWCIQWMKRRSRPSISGD